MSVDQAIGHRLRCVTVKAGVINICPDCGQVTITDFFWDFHRDPHPELGPISVGDEFVDVLREIVLTVALPCLDCEVS